jgi:ketosteroid isomerase-like protein
MLQQNNRHTRDHKRKILNPYNLRRLRHPPQNPRSHSHSIRLTHYHHFRQRHMERRVMPRVPGNMANINNTKARVVVAFAVEEAIKTAGGVSSKTGRSLSTRSRIVRHGFW